MKFINKKNFCRELSTIHKSGGSYDSLDKKTQSQVLQDLLQEQGFLCGFCMRRISEKDATIEHLIGQNFNHAENKGYDYNQLVKSYQSNIEELVGKIKKPDFNKIGKKHDTNYANMIAVCQGDKNKFCLDGITCDKKRAKHQAKRPIIFITPLNKMKMDNIIFSENGRVHYKESLDEKEIEALRETKKLTQQQRDNGFEQYNVNYHLSEDENIQYDLNHVLNLNCNRLVEERGAMLKRIRIILFYETNAKTRKKRAIELLEKWEKKTDNKFDEFCQVAIYLLKKYT